jgi:excisionase family DNA binding protein
MRFSAAELAEIRKAFRQRIATAPARKRAPRANRKREPSPKRKSEPKAAPVLVREPEYDDGDILTPGEMAELFAVSPRTVRLWADAGRLPSFRTVGGQRRSDGRTFGAPQVPDFVQGRRRAAPAPLQHTAHHPPATSRGQHLVRVLASNVNHEPSLRDVISARPTTSQGGSLHWWTTHPFWPTTTSPLVTPKRLLLACG